MFVWKCNWFILVLKVTKISDINGHESKLRFIRTNLHQTTLSRLSVWVKQFWNFAHSRTLRLLSGRHASRVHWLKRVQEGAGRSETDRAWVWHRKTISEHFRWHLRVCFQITSTGPDSVHPSRVHSPHTIGTTDLPSNYCNGAQKLQWVGWFESQPAQHLSLEMTLKSSYAQWFSKPLVITPPCYPIGLLLSLGSLAVSLCSIPNRHRACIAGIPSISARCRTP